MSAHRHKWQYMGGQARCTVKGCGKFLHPDGSVTDSPRAPKNAKRRAPRSNQRDKENSPEVERAAQLFRDFRELEPGEVTPIEIKLPRAAMVVGEIELIAYNTDHDGKAERYLHKFRRGARPMLLASDDGKTLLIWGGNFVFTERGIVDGKARRR